MKKTIITLFFSLLMFQAMAGMLRAQEVEKQITDYNFFSTGIPILCGTPDEVGRYTKDKGFEVFNVSVGKAGARPDGEVVYYVFYWFQPSGTQTMVTISNLNMTESCILYHSYEKTLSPMLGTEL